MHGGKRAGAGKPKGYRAPHTLQSQTQRQYVIEAFEKEIEPITKKAIQQAKKGDRYARDWLSNRAWGTPKATMDMNVRPAIPFDDYVEDTGIQEDTESK